MLFEKLAKVMGGKYKVKGEVVEMNKKFLYKKMSAHAILLDF